MRNCISPMVGISNKKFERAILQAEQELEPIVSAYRETSWQQAVGTSGTIKTIRDIIVGLGWHPVCIEYEHFCGWRNLLVAAGVKNLQAGFTHQA